MPRRVSPARIKANRNYEIEECAEALGVTPQTVRQWIRQGLPALTERRPYLVLGWQVKGWLGARQVSRSRPLQDGEFFCLTCKEPRRAAFGLTERTETADGRPVLTGFCERCEALCRRFLSRT
ncbi:MerR family transcriptional regulator [Roseivivax sediminis]|uniref:Helix-turn-helix domain-containing protein n=1 Tax=Roseivivax sediminis TaxID=936889 RepID=A0A1I1VQ24_9RHOB|nr:hypothetical protein [Roseivivax sediminis]SFD85076.1 hypothetical protein SAMN04515678_103342 [Roseivivax sediminis]